MGLIEKKYSVLMSVYRKEKPENLKSSVESMVKQTVRPSQIVVVKDGPLTDELENVLNEFVQSNPDVFNIIKLDSNVGLAQALNIGLQCCKYSLVARMDSDDISKPDRCEKQLLEFIANPNLSIVGTNIDEFDEDIHQILCTRKVPEQYEDIFQYIHRRSPFNHVTVMYKKEDVLRCGNYQIRWKEDLDLFFRMLNNGCRAKNIQESLVLVRVNQDGIRRRKSWDYCGSFIKVAYINYKRKYLKLFDFLFIAGTQIAIYIMPINLYQWLLFNVLREKSKL